MSDLIDLTPYVFGEGGPLQAGRGTPLIPTYVFPPPGALWSAGSEVETDQLGTEWGGVGDESGSGDGGGGIYGSGGARSFVTTTEQSKSGKKSLKITIDTSVEETGIRFFRWHEPQNYPDAYYSCWYFIPQLVTVPNWWNIMQFKSKRNPPNDHVNNAMFTLNVGNRPNGNMFLYLYQHGAFLGGSDQSHHQTVMDIPVGKWFNIEWHMVQSTGNNADGSLTIWQDGVELFNITNVRTKYSDGDQQWSTTSYSDALIPAEVTIYQDDVAISLSRIWNA